MMERKDLDYLDSLKCIVILCIVLNHSIQYKWNVYKILTNDCQNPIMIFISGIVFSYCIVNMGKYSTLQNLLQKKLKRLIIPLVLTLLFWYIPIMKLVNVFVTVEPYEQPLYKILITNIMGLNLDQLWFVYALFLMYFLLWLVIKKTGLLNSHKGELLVIGIAYLLNLFLHVKSTQYFCISNIMRYMIFFVGGYIYNTEAQHLDRGKDFKRWFLIGAILLVVSIYIYDYNTSFIAGKTFDGNIIVGTVGACLEVFKQFGLLFIVCYFIKWLYENTMCLKNTFSDYLIQQSKRLNFRSILRL